MIHSILEGFQISWEERLGTGMTQTIDDKVDDVVFRYERNPDKTLVVTHLKDDVPVHKDIYEIDNLGRLKKTISKDGSDNIFWIYEYEIKDDEVFVTRTNHQREVLRYKFVITLRDSNGRILFGEYRALDSNIATEIISCQRDEKGNLLRETLSDNEGKLTFFFDSLGRYKKFEVIVDGNVKIRQEYKH